MIHHGDCLDVMAAMEPESVDAKLVPLLPHELQPIRRICHDGEYKVAHEFGGLTPRHAIGRPRPAPTSTPPSTTGLACEIEGFPWVGIEREEEYVKIAEARLNGTQRGLGLVG